MSFNVFVDSDAFVGFFFEKDAHYKTASALFQSCIDQKIHLVTSNYIVSETATVLSRRSSQTEAVLFLKYTSSGAIPIIYVDELIQKRTMEIFSAQENKDTSFFDCSNVALMEHLRIPKILSFDQVYAKKFKLTLFSK